MGRVKDDRNDAKKSFQNVSIKTVLIQVRLGVFTALARTRSADPCNENIDD